MRLRGNELDGRVVSSSDGLIGAGWGDFQTLPGAGGPAMHAATLRIRTTADWRVVFRKPSDEGLRTIIGPTVRITVTGGCAGSPCPLSAPIADPDPLTAARRSPMAARGRTRSHC